MKKLFMLLMVLTTLTLNIKDLACSDNSKSDIEAEISRNYNNISSDVKETVIQFRLAKGCYEEYKDLSKDCKGLTKGSKTTRKDFSDAKEHYEQALEKLVDNKLAKDEYSVSDFKLVLYTLAYKKYKKPNKELTPSFPSALLFPREQKNSIIKELFDNKDLTAKRTEKIKVLLLFAKEIDEKRSTFPTEEADEPLNSDDMSNADESVNTNIKITNFKKVITERVKTKNDIFCPDLMHFTVAKNNLELAKFIIDQYKEVFGKKFGREDAPKKLENYLNAKTYDPIPLAEAQAEYARQHKDMKQEMSVCDARSVTSKLSKFQQFMGQHNMLDMKQANEKKAIQDQINTLSKYSSLEIAYLFGAQTNPKVSLDILLLLLESGAKYGEDLVDARDKSEKEIKQNDDLYRLKKQIPKYYTTIFKDFLMIGGSLDVYRPEKEKILRALVEADKRQSKNQVKQRYESLLDQAIEYKNKYWCNVIINNIVLNEDNNTFRSDLYTYTTRVQPNSDKQERKIDRAEMWANLLNKVNPDNTRKHNRAKNSRINQIETTPVEAAEGSSCEEMLIGKAEIFYDQELKPNIYNDFNTWKTGKEVYSALHYQAQQKTFSKESVATKELIKKLYANKVSTEEIFTFIMNAKDSKGKTPWSYGINQQFPTESELKKYIEATVTNNDVANR